MMKRAMSWGLTLLLCFSIITPVLADELDDRQAELDSVRAQMQEKQAQAAQAQKKVQSEASRLEAADRQLAAAENELAGVETRRRDTEGQIDRNQVVLANTEKSLQARTAVYAKRLRNIYENGQINYLDVLFGAKDFQDFSTRMELLKRVIKFDVNLMDKIKAERQLIIVKRQELEEQKATLVALEQETAAKRAVVAQRRAERAAILNQAISERDQAEAEYQDLMATSQQIEAMIQQIQAGGQFVGNGSGAMMWPYIGPITSPYGWRTHPISGVSRYHSGIDIGADYGDTVVAADSGTVAYADWFGGYGNAVIIEHGGGVSTLYGHNSSLLVSVGQSVRKGQPIAYAGSTGYSTGPHVHFEVRVHGEPTNPMDYLP